jgi:hypothetical protein
MQYLLNSTGNFEIYLLYLFTCYLDGQTKTNMPNADEGLKRVIGVSALALTIVNFTIGAGIFALPAIVGIEMGAFGVFSYLFCGVMLAAIMLCYAETGSQVTSTAEVMLM